VYRQVREIGERSRSEEVIDVRQRRLKPPGQRCVIDSADQWVEPDQPVTASLQPSHLFAQNVGIPAVPSVRNQQHNGSLMKHATRPPLMKLAECGTYPCPARPIGHDSGHCVDGFLEPPKTDLSCDARESSCEQKHFEPPVTMGQAMGEVKKHA
jgi:hypothetical protein